MKPPTRLVHVSLVSCMDASALTTHIRLTLSTFMAGSNVNVLIVKQEAAHVMLSNT